MFLNEEYEWYNELSFQTSQVGGCNTTKMLELFFESSCILGNWVGGNMQINVLYFLAGLMGTHDEETW
jgi:hypothetical protein